jgi:hypothetical protein
MTQVPQKKQSNQLWKTSSLEDVKLQIQKPKTFVEVWKSDELSISKIGSTYDNEIKETSVLIQLAELVEISGADLSKTQVNFLVDEIIEKYFYFRLSEFRLVAKVMVNEKAYGKPSIQDILQAFKEYDEERSNIAVNQNELMKKDSDGLEDIETFRAKYIDRVLKSMEQPEIKPKQVIKPVQPPLKQTGSLTTQAEIDKMNQEFLDNL